MADIIDNRKTKPATENRKRYMDRERERVQRAIRHGLKKIGMKDLQSGKDVEIEIAKDYGDEHIGIDTQSGVHKSIGTGNTDHSVGETWDINRNGQGQGYEGDPDADDSEANFNFTMTAKEFMDIFFNMYSLDYLPKKVTIEESGTTSYVHAGFVSDGPPSKLNVVRTYRNSIGRTLAEKQDYLEQLEQTDDEEEKAILEEKIKNIPLFRDSDLRFTFSVPEPVVRHRCVMFCLMDVSGSMEENQRHLAKQFFLLVYIFLQRAYKDVEVVFIRHTTDAEEVDENTFFYSDKSGGTVMTSAVKLMNEIIKDKYDPLIWNSYAIHASDGGNYSGDDALYYDMLRDTVAKAMTTFVYLETPNPYWGQGKASPFMKKMQAKIDDKELSKRIFKTALLKDHNQIWLIFAELFQNGDKHNEKE